MDPLEKFACAPHVIDLVFQHLNLADELMAARKLSNAYNNYILTSKHTKRLKMVFNFKTNVPEFRDLRKKFNCQNIELNCRKMSSESIVNHTRKIYSGHWKWRNVYMKHVNVSLAQFAQIKLFMLQKTEGVFIEEFKINDYLVIDKLLKIDNLKSFGAKSCCTSVIIEFLNQNRNLTKLVLVEVNLIEIIQHLIELQICNLEELQITEYGRYTFEQEKKDLTELLQMNANTLKIMKFDMWIGLPCIITAFGMPNLKSLQLFDMAKADSHIDYSTLELPICPSLEILDMQDLNQNCKLLKLVLKAAPNLKSLRIYSLHTAFIKVIIETSQKLQRLSASFMDKCNQEDQNLIKKLRKTCVVTIEL